MAFAYFNRNIPDEAHKMTGEMGPSGVQAFATTSSGGWVLVVKGGYYARGIPDECFEHIGTLVTAGVRVRTVAFHPEGGWVVVADNGYLARGIPDECFTALGDMWDAGARPTCIAFPYPGGNRWVILAGKSLIARNIDDECFQQLVNYAAGLRPAEQVSFTKDGGWTILAQDRYWARNIPDECYEQMGAFSADLLVDHVTFFPDGGWSVISNTERPSLPSDPLREWEGRMTQVGGSWKSIWDRMADLNVVGVGVAAVIDNQVAWATSYGRVEKGSADWVHNDTVFQAASCSKPVSAIGFLRLVQDDLVDLDENVNPKLGWKLPRRACTEKEWRAKVTLRLLLQHSAGIIGRDAADPPDTCSGFDEGGAGGFGGYPDTPGVGVPTLAEVLAGHSDRPGVTVNSRKIEMTYEPGTMSAYSGESFVMMMQLLEHQRSGDATFEDWMNAHVLAPAGMANSEFSLTAPSFSGPPTSGHLAGGSPIAGKRNRYPEFAAAGLYTTPHDLGRFVIAVNQRGAIDGGSILDGTLVDDLMTNSLGMPTGNAGQPDSWFWHNGGNAGYACQFKGYPGQRAGLVVMTNGEGDDTDDAVTLYTEIAAALVRTYGWE